MSFFGTKYNNFSDEKLLLLIQQSNVPAFNELYHRYSQRILNYFFRMLGNEEKAQDFIQDLFLKIIEKQHSAPVKNFSSWIFTIAHNMCKNEYRNQKVRNVFDTNVDLDSMPDKKTSGSHFSEKALDQKLFEKAINDELDKMDEARRGTFLLKYQENFTIKEICKIMNCSEGTTKSRLFYTTKKLAEKLKAFNPNKIEV